MHQSIGYLGPEGQTFGWDVARQIVKETGIDVKLIPFDSQPDMVEKVLKGETEIDACVAAYSSNIASMYVPVVGEEIIRFARRIENGVQQLAPNQILAVGRKPIKQRLIGIDKKISHHDIKKIYAHKVAEKQTSSWRKRNTPNAIIEECRSNGDAINKALKAQDPHIVAIGPEFGMNKGQVLLEEGGIDNYSESETSFALIANPKKSLRLPEKYNHKGLYGGMTFTKIDDSKHGSISLPGLITTMGLSVYSTRHTNSPKSALPVAWKDLEHEDEGALIEGLETLQKGNPDMEMTIKGNGNEIIINGTEGMLETSRLGSYPIIQLD